MSREALNPNQFEMVHGHYGPTRYIDAKVGDTQVGRVEYTHRKDQVRIKSVWTHADYRRQGIATKLMGELRQHHPEAPIDPGDFTEVGRKWWGASQGPVR